MRSQAFVSLVVYTQNEATTVVDFLMRADALLADSFEYHELVLVVDHGTDDTAAKAAQIAPSLRGSTTILELARHHGVESGIIAGLERAIGDFVFELETTQPDFDLQLLRKLYEQAATGVDIVAAGYDQLDWRHRMFYRLLNRYSNLGVELANERVRLVSRRALNAMLALREKVRYRKALYALTGFPHERMSYARLPGSAFQRRMDRESVGLAFDILLSFSTFGLRVAHVLSLAFAGFSLLVIIYSVIVYLFFENVAAGWTTLILVLSIGLAGLFFILGVIGEYLARIFVEVRARPLYALRRAQVYRPAPSSIEVATASDSHLLEEPSFFRAHADDRGDAS